jgi:hypothetical protein
MGHALAGSIEKRDREREAAEVCNVHAARAAWEMASRCCLGGGKGGAMRGASSGRYYRCSREAAG